MAAAASDSGERPPTRSKSTLFLAMCAAAVWIVAGRFKLQQNRAMKSAEVITFTLFSIVLMISLKQRPISFLETREMAHTS